MYLTCIYCITLSGYSPRRSFSDDVSIPIDQVVVHRGEKQVHLQKGYSCLFLLWQGTELEPFLLHKN